MLEKPIYLITDGGKLRSEGKLLWAIEQAFLGAEQIGFLQIREQVKHSAFKAASELELKQIVLSLKPLCAEYGVKLLINSRIDLAKDHDLDGVHLGKNSGSIKEARVLLGEEKLIGYSAHSEQELSQSFAQGANYAFISPIFKPLSKEIDRLELGLEELKRISQIFPEKVIFALGGITKTNWTECLDAGASGVAMISSILLNSDPKQAAKEFV